MRYILCEDEGSGFQFFEHLVTAFPNVLCELHISKGNKNFKNKFKSLQDKFNNGDRILLALDCVASEDKFNYGHVIRDIEHICLMKGVKVDYTKYYCFEELFISYSELINFAASTGIDENWLETLKYVNNAIMKEEAYFDRNNEYIELVIQKMKSAGKTREKFAKILLRNTTNKLHMDFSIDDSHLGKCWILSCVGIEFKNKRYVCENCGYGCKDNNIEYKLNSLEKNSQIKLYKSFSEFFMD